MRLGTLITENSSVQEHAKSGQSKTALIALSPYARKAVQQEILPQLEESVLSESMVDELCEETKLAIQAAFSYKNPVYNRLIGYKTIDQSDEQFRDDLLVVMDEWSRATKRALNHAEPQTAEQQPVEVTVSVQGGETSDTPEIHVKDMQVEDAHTAKSSFDLSDIRM